MCRKLSIFVITEFGFGRSSTDIANDINQIFTFDSTKNFHFIQKKRAPGSDLPLWIGANSFIRNTRIFTPANLIRIIALSLGLGEIPGIGGFYALLEIYLGSLPKVLEPGDIQKFQRGSIRFFGIIDYLSFRKDKIPDQFG